MQDENRPNANEPVFLDGRKRDTRQYHIRWPNQPDPTASQKRLWKRCIVSSYLRYIPYWKATPLGVKEQQHVTYLEKPLILPSQSFTPQHRLSHLENIKRQTRTQQRLLDDLQQVATDVQVWRAFCSKECLYIASDGGLHAGQHGTFGWVISTNKHVLFKCGGPVDGPYDTVNSTRSELCGFASSLLLIAYLSRTWGLRHTCTFRWFTDSKSAISKIERTSRRGPTAGRRPHKADLLSLIRSLAAAEGGNTKDIGITHIANPAMT